jgi:hypothetical protein
MKNHNFEVLAGHETQNYTFDNLSGRKLLEIFKGNEELDNFVTITNLNSRVDKQKKKVILVDLIIIMTNIF